MNTTGEGTSDTSGTSGSTTGDACRDLPCEVTEEVVMPGEPESCVLHPADWPRTPELTRVSIDQTVIPRVEDCATEDGWVYRDFICPNDAIELCGQSCLDLKLVGEALVEYFCWNE